MTAGRAAQAYLKYSRGAIEVIAFVVLVAMVVINTAEITYRFLFHGGLSWVQEVSIVLAMVLYFLVYAWVAKDREYIRIELLVRVLRPVWRRRFSIGTRVLVLVFHGMLVWYGTQTTVYSRLFETPVLGWPEVVFYAPLALGCADIVITELIYLVWQLRGTVDPRTEEHMGVLY